MRIIVLIMFFVAVCGTLGYAEQNEKKLVFDCGVNALYLVRRLKGMDADLKEISENLPRDPEKGSSIHDLEAYLNSSDIRTDSRLMRMSDLCKKRGVLAILLTHPHGNDQMGHFVVARILGSRQLQIIDSLFGAYIDENAANKRKTFPVILIDHQSHEWTWRLFTLTSVSLLGFLGLVIIKRQRTGITDEHR